MVNILKYKIFFLALTIISIFRAWWTWGQMWQDQLLLCFYVFWRHHAHLIISIDIDLLGADCRVRWNANNNCCGDACPSLSWWSPAALSQHQQQLHKHWSPLLPSRIVNEVSRSCTVPCAWRQAAIRIFTKLLACQFLCVPFSHLLTMFTRSDSIVSL